MKNLIKIAFLSVLVLSLLVPFTVYGTSITFELGWEFSGATPPAGPLPWMTATFDDSFGGSNTVRLTMSTINLIDDEFVGEWDFNFDPALDPTLLAFNPVDIADSEPDINTGIDAFRADGDGWYDIQFDFPQRGGPTNNRFEGQEIVTYDLSYPSAIDVSSFNQLSVGGNLGEFPTAAHVQGIGPDADFSGWVTVPEPSALLLIGSLLIVIGVIKRKF